LPSQEIDHGPRFGDCVSTQRLEISRKWRSIVGGRTQALRVLAAIGDLDEIGHRRRGQRTPDRLMRMLSDRTNAAAS
jgi:hypothetical protein